MIRQLLSIIALGCVSTVGFAASGPMPGRVDPTFVPPTSGTPDRPVLSVASQPEGKVIIAGAFTRIGQFTYRGIARLKTDGSIDPTFNPGSGADDVVNCVTIQADGKALVGGLFGSIDGNPIPKIARLNADGSIDPDFRSAFSADGNVNAIALQTDGSILVGGSFSLDGHTNVARLKPDGTIDANFSAIILGGVVNSILIQPDQRIILAGTFTNVNGMTQNRITRLNADGSSDSTFDPGPGADGPIYSACFGSNGRIFVGGRFSSVGGSSRNFLAALDTDGSVTDTFSSGSGPNDAVFAVCSVGDSIIAGGRFTEVNGTALQALARFHSDGSLDDTFQNGAKPNGGFVFGLCTTVNSNLVVAGSFTDIGGAPLPFVARVDSQGLLDSKFNPGKGISSDIYSIIPLSNGEILIGGGFRNVNGRGQSGLAKLQSDGSLDEAFVPPLTNTFVASAALQSSGNIVIGGVIATNGTTSFIRLARIRANGSFDTTFNTGTGLDGRVQAIAIQPDDRILIIGSFQRYHGLTARGIVRLNPDGALDTTFSSGAGPDNNINALAVQTDGKIVIGGDFTKYNSGARPHIARLNANGSLDSSFNSLAKTDFGVSAILLQSDGKTLIGGDFETVNGVKRRGIALLFADGSLDTSLDPGQGPNSHVGVMIQQTDGKIAIGGFFTTVAGQPRNYFARLNSDGSLDTTFESSAGADSFVYALALQQDNQLLVGGSFGNADGEIRSHVARILNNLSGPPIHAMPAETSDVFNLTLQPDARLQGIIETSEDFLTWIRQTQLQIAPGTNSVEITLPTTNANRQFFRMVFDVASP